MFERIFKDKRATTKVSFAILSIFILLFSIVMIVAVDSPTITTDKEDYAPEETVWISGSGFSEASESNPINIQVTRPNDDVHVCPDSTWCPASLPTTSSFSDYEYILDGIDGEYTIKASDGVNVVEKTFTDSIYELDLKIPKNTGITWSGTKNINFDIDVQGAGSNTVYFYYSDTGCHCSGSHQEPSSISGDSYWHLIGSHSGYSDGNKNYAWDTTTVSNDNDYCILIWDGETGIAKDLDKSNNVFEIDNGEEPECISDSDCAYLNQNTCSGDNWVHQTGECNQAGVCVAASSTASCNDGLFCNGAETCEGEGICTNPADVVCNSPSSSCYLSEGTCNEDKDSCDYTFSDTEGPLTSNVLVDPNYNNGIFDATALATDQCSNIATSEYFLRKSSVTMNCGTPGTGTSMDVSDGSFDEKIEDVMKDNIEFFQDGSNRICVQSKDSLDNWGNCECYYFETDTIPPELVGEVELNDVQNPDELLVCGTNPTLTVSVCDSQSDIQGGEFFLDLTIPPSAIPAPWSGYWLTVGNQYMNGGLHCADLSATIDLDDLTDGTHYINQIRGKDIVENWGKIYGQNFGYSFIKDTLAPITTKTLNPADQISVSCDITEANGKTITNGCAYVKQGTTITLTATDPDPQQTGEFAGNVVIYYNIYWRLTENDEWTLDQSGQSGVNQDAIITLSKDSYHLIEYWATDGCQWAEEKHYELDIVDTQAPATTEVITGPKYVVEDKTYLDGVTEIELTCTDPQPHPVDDVTLYARYSVDGGDLINIKTSEGYAKFTFPEESQHTLEYWCVDALGNTEQTHTELYYVDHTKPVTTLALGTPLVQSNPDGQGWIKKWITSQNSITLDAVDPDTTQMGCNSGVDETQYRITLVADQYCNSAESGCSYAVGSGEYQNYDYEEAFTIGESSCHLIEYYSVDNVDKTEVTKRDCVFVDNDAPVFNEKYVGEPKVEASGDYDWYVTQDTTICVSAEDILPHPVGGVEISCNVEQWNTDETQESTPDKTYSLQLDKGCFHYTEDSYHKLTCTATDALGNSATLTEKDIVDTLEPTSNKVVGEPQYADEETLFVTSSTPITFTCEDQTPHPIGNEKLCFKVGYDLPQEWTDITNSYCGERQVGENGYCCVDVNENNQFIFNFNENEDSSHMLEYYCEDGLGNKPAEATIEYDDVDDTPPSIFFVNPTPDFANDVKQCIQSVVVKITDEKSGLDESSIHAVLINSEQQVVRNESLIKQTIGSTITYQAMMDKELPAGTYQLVVYASDNLGNLGSNSRTEILTESVFAFVSDNTCSDLDVEEGGDCEIQFNVCMRGGNSIKFWMDKSFSSAISSGIVSPELMDATITNGGEGEADVGLQELLSGVGYEECIQGAPEAQWIDGKCWFISDTETLPLSCVEINGRTQFTLHLSLSSDITTLLGTGVHETTYWLESTDDDSLCEEQLLPA